MPLLPEGLFPKVALILILVGLAVVLKRGVPKAYGLALLMMAVFALDLIGELIGQGGTQEQMGFIPSRFLAGEAWWSPLTSIFSHAPGGRRISLFQLHVVGNVLIMITAGPALEDRIGEKRFLTIFFTAALAALVAHVALAYLTPITNPDTLALGASGGLFGILTAFAVRYPREKLPLILFFIFWIPSFALLLVYLGLNLFFMFGSTSVAWWGHFAGFLVGLPFAYTLPPAPDAPAPGSPAAARGLPDAAKLEPFATTPQLRRILDRIKQFTPETRTRDDATYASAWLDKFFAKATCPQGHEFKRSGLKATCEGGETTIDFARS